MDTTTPPPLPRRNFVGLTAAVKLPIPLLKTENQDSRKSCKMRNFADYNFF